MTRVIAGMTISVDGYITGPNDGPGRGLGDGGERLHYWDFGGPWTYDDHPAGEPAGVDLWQANLDQSYQGDAALQHVFRRRREGDAGSG